MQFQLDIIKTPSGFLKLWEIALTIIIISVTQGIKYFTFGSEIRVFFCGGVFIAAMIVTPLILTTYLRGFARDLQKTPLELKLNFVMAVLMVSAGAVTIHTSFNFESFENLTKQADAGKAAGSFAIINGILYGVDAYFAKVNMD